MAAGRQPLCAAAQKLPHVPPCPPPFPPLPKLDRRKKSGERGRTGARAGSPRLRDPQSGQPATRTFVAREAARASLRSQAATKRSTMSSLSPTNDDCEGGGRRARGSQPEGWGPPGVQKPQRPPVAGAHRLLTFMRAWQSKAEGWGRSTRAAIWQSLTEASAGSGGAGAGWAGCCRALSTDRGGSGEQRERQPMQGWAE